MAREPFGSPWRTREESSLFLRTVLWLVDRLRVPLTALGVEHRIFRELLRTRVVMDLRPVSTSGNAMGVAGIVIVVLMTWLAGLGTGILALVGKRELWLAGSLSALILLQLFFLLQALVGILVDPADVRALAPHPVPDRTLYAVRLAQVFAYLAILASAFTAGNVLLAVFRQPILPTLLVFPLLAVLCTLCALGGVALFFALLLRLAGPAHFQRVSLWVQVASAMVLMGGFQLGPRLVPEGAWPALLSALQPWKLLWPPFQGACVFALAAGEWTSRNLLGLACALAMPALALFVTLRLASRSYVAGLEGVLTLGGGARTRWPKGFLARIAGWICRSREQRAGFDFTLALSRREPHVLRAALPQFVSFQVMAVAIGSGELRRHGASDVFLCMSAGMVAYVLPTLLELCQSTPEPEARWLFLAAPITAEAELLRGGVKALLVGWYGMSLAVVGVVQLCFAGPEALARILLALEFSALLALFYARRFALGVPFTLPLKKIDNFANIGLILTMFLALAILCGAHWALTRHPLALAAGVLGAGVLLVLQWRSLDTMPVSPERRLFPPRAKGGG